jgi:hypothetical protein
MSEDTADQPNDRSCELVGRLTIAAGEGQWRAPDYLRLVGVGVVIITRQRALHSHSARSYQLLAIMTEKIRRPTPVPHSALFFTGPVL